MLYEYNHYFKIVIISILPFSLTSCSNKEKERLYLEVDRNLWESNNELAKENEYIFSRLEQEKVNFETIRRANQLEPKLKRIKKISDEFLAYLESLETLTSFSREDEKVFYDSLNKYKKNILSIDEKTTQELSNSIYLSDFTFSFRKQIANKALKKLVINKFKNDILRCENQVLQCCHKRVYTVSYSCGKEQPKPIVTLNTKHIKQGEYLEITAGMGIFVRNGYLTLFINNEKLNISDYNQVSKKIKINKQPGKYHFPVRMNYQKPDGTMASLEQQIEYIVDE